MGYFDSFAKDKATEVKYHDDWSSGLSEEEINKWNDAETHKEEDKKRKEAVEARNSKRRASSPNSKSLDELGEKNTDEDRAKIEVKAKWSKRNLKDDSATKEQIDAKVKKLAR